VTGDWRPFAHASKHVLCRRCQADTSPVLRPVCSPFLCTDFRLWYVRSVTAVASSVDAGTDAAADRKQQLQTPGCGGGIGSSAPVEIGYMNVIPKCNEWAGPFPVYESLPETYAAINTYLADQPLEGWMEHAAYIACERRFVAAIVYNSARALYVIGLRHVTRRKSACGNFLSMQ
jgi:hypothetical protein